jgi:hypothetical protein
MDAGLFDPVDMQSYTSIPFETINSDRAVASTPIARVAQERRLATRAAAGQRNERLALIGPHTQMQKDLAGDYFEDIGLGMCAGAPCVPILRAAFDKVGSGEAVVAAGCDMRVQRHVIRGRRRWRQTQDVRRRRRRERQRRGASGWRRRRREKRQRPRQVRKQPHRRASDFLAKRIMCSAGAGNRTETNQQSVSCSMVDRMDVLDSVARHGYLSAATTAQTIPTSSA